MIPPVPASCACALLLIGGHPAAPAEIRLADSVPWYASPGAGAAPPRVVAPCPGESGGWRIEFRGGDARKGYAEVVLDGDRLQAAGLRAFRLEYRTTAAAGVPELVLVTALGAYRTHLPATDGAWTTRSVALGDFVPDPTVSGPPTDDAPRRLRVEAPDGGLAADATVDLRGIVLECDPASPSARTAAARPPVPAARFLRGPFLLGSNRALLDSLGAAGGNVTTEYSGSWPLDVLADHLDYARAAGVGVIAGITAEENGKVIRADARFAPLAVHPALVAWYVFDEPDGGRSRGLPAADVAPAALAARSRPLAPVPTLVTCLNPIGLQPYAGTASMLATDYYLPAGAPERSFTVIHADAEADAETAARTGATPLHAIQLADPHLQPAQTPASLRAQTLGALAAGVRGVLYFQGAYAARAADEGLADGELWDAFLSLCGELASLGPLAGEWSRVRGEPSLGGEMSEVRASCFRDGDETWIVLVNLGRAAAPVHLGGACLDGALRLEEPGSGWSVPVRKSGWDGTLAALEGHVLRVVRDGGGGSAPRLVERVPIDGAGPLRFDRAVAGGTIFPAPAGSVRLELDGVDRTADARIRTGAAADVRVVATGLADGTHTVALSWDDRGVPARESWTFDVAAPVRLPFRDDFDRAELGPGWGVCDDVRWNPFARDETPAAGRVDVENGELHVLSTGGGIGALLRWFEAPPSFRLRLTARLERAGRIELARGDVHWLVDLPAGESHVEIDEAHGVRVVRVDGRETRRETLPIYHRGGNFALGVPHGGEARFDDLEILAR